jgi:hypothetical protein
MLGLTDDQNLVTAAAQLLRQERSSDPGSFDAVRAQQMSDPVPEWLLQEP